MLIRNRSEEPLTDWGAECFYCGDPLHYPFVEWHGHEMGLEVYRVIGLHVQCATRLAIHLLTDCDRLNPPEPLKPSEKYAKKLVASVYAAHDRRENAD